MTELLSSKPYKAQFVQKRDEEDFQDRVEVRKTLIPIIEDNSTREGLFSFDEATLYLHELVNKHNISY